MENITIMNPMTGDNYTKNQTFIRHRLITSKIVIYSVVCLLGTIGNGLVLWFGILRMKKTVNVVWFLNLAVTDFIFTLFLPLRITFLVIHHWPFGPVVCDLYWFLFFLNTSVNILQLMVISLDRFFCVFFPIWCQNHRKPRLALLVSLSIWIASIIFCLFHFIFSGKFWKRNASCSRQAYISGEKWVAIVKFVFFFLLPFLMIVSCYIAISLRMRGKQMTASSRPYKIILAIVIAFLICWCPYNLFVLLNTLDTGKIAKNVLRIGNTVSDNLMLINSCINPILYVLIGRDFKQQFCSSLLALSKKVFIKDFENTVSKKQEGSTDNRELSEIKTLKDNNVIELFNPSTDCNEQDSFRLKNPLQF